MGKTELIARAVIIYDRQILLVRKKKSDYSFLPGGHVEFGESAVSALRREIKEETGLRISVRRFLGVIEHCWRKRRRRHAEVNLVFAAQLNKPAATVRSVESKLEFFWQDIGRLKDVNLMPSCLARILPVWINTQPHPSWASDFPAGHLRIKNSDFSTNERDRRSMTVDQQ